MRTIVIGLSCLFVLTGAMASQAQIEQEPLSIGVADDNYSVADDGSGAQVQQAPRQQQPSVVARSEPTPAPRPSQDRATAPAPSTDGSWWWWRRLTDY